MDEQTTELYAHRTPRGYRDFFKSILQVEYGSHPDCPIERVRLTTDPDGAFWAWWDAERSAHYMVFPEQMLLETCFTYGSKAEEDRRRGKVVRVRVERIEDLAPR